MTEPVLTFAGLLRQLRAEARLTQEELAEAAGLSPRSVSDLERGINRTARKDTAILLADALSLTGEVRMLFIAAARGRAEVAEVLAAKRDEAARPGGTTSGTAAATRSLPRDIGSFTGREPELARLLGSLADLAAGGGLPGVCVIDGMPGIGKTTLVVHAAHRLAASFPDGQFFLPLHAHTPGHRPVSPADALASLPKFDEADTLGNLGWVRRLTGDYPAAAASSAEAIELFRDLGSRHDLAMALNGLGELSFRTSAIQAARFHHGQALAIAREVGAPAEEARALEGIGRSLLRQDPAEAAAYLRRALGIYQNIGAPDARRVQDALDGQGR
jgi:transcriptional regulator with XRE-family HTH domain